MADDPISVKIEGVVLSRDVFDKLYRQSGLTQAGIVALAVLLCWVVSEIRRLSTEQRVTQEYVMQFRAQIQPQPKEND